MKQRVKDRMHLLGTDLKYTYFSLMAGNTACITKGDRISMVMAFIAVVLYVGSGQAFAAGGLIDDAGEIANSIFGDLGRNITKVAGLALGICIIWFLICTNDDDAKRPLKWGKRILIGYLIFMLMGAIFNFIDSKAQGHGFNDYY